VRWIKLTHVGFRGHVKIASCIVSYCIETRVKYRGGHCLLCPPVIILGDMSPCPPPPVSGLCAHYTPITNRLQQVHFIIRPHRRSSLARRVTQHTAMHQAQLLTRSKITDLQNILRQSYDNAKVTIDLRRTSDLQNILRVTQGFSRILFTCKIVRSSEIVFVN